MLLGDFLNTLATQSGFQAEDATLKALLSNVQVSTYDIPDDFVSKINSSLLTMESAKNNPVLKNLFRAELYNGLDKEINGTITELGLPDEVKTRLLAETSSFKRASLLAKEVKALEAEKAGAKGGDKTALETQIRELNAAILQEKSNYQSGIDKVKGEYNEKFTGLLLDNEFSKFSYDASKPIEDNMVLAKYHFEKGLSDKKLKVVNDNGKLSLETEEGLKHFEANKEVSFKDFASGIFAQQKLLAVSEAPKPEDQKTIITSTQSNGKNSFASKAEESARQFD